MSDKFMLWDETRGKPKRGTQNETSFQSQINVLTSGTPKEIVFSVSSDTHTDFSVDPNFVFDPSNLVHDITVFKNVSRQYLSESGLIADGHYKKLNTTTIRFLYFLKSGDKVCIRKEGNVGNQNLEYLNVSPQPASDGAQSLGSNVRSWDSFFVKDRVTHNPVQVVVSGGSLVVLS